VECGNDSGAVRQWLFHLYNGTTTANVPDSDAYFTFDDLGAVFHTSFTFSTLVTTVTDNNIIQVWVDSDSAAANQTIFFATSKIIYVKLS
jgi:hypothetical protein